LLACGNIIVLLFFLLRNYIGYVINPKCSFFWFFFSFRCSYLETKFKYQLLLQDIKLYSKQQIETSPLASKYSSYNKIVDSISGAVFSIIIASSCYISSSIIKLSRLSSKSISVITSGFGSSS